MIRKIKDLIVSSYVHRVFNELDPEAIKNAFHRNFAIFPAKGEELDRYEIENWIASVTKKSISTSSRSSIVLNF